MAVIKDLGVLVSRKTTMPRKSSSIEFPRAGPCSLRDLLLLCLHVNESFLVKKKCRVCMDFTLGKNADFLEECMKLTGNCLKFLKTIDLILK